jgi:hypothetical protein
MEIGWWRIARLGWRIWVWISLHRLGSARNGKDYNCFTVWAVYLRPEIFLRKGDLTAAALAEFLYFTHSDRQYIYSPYNSMGSVMVSKLNGVG